MVACVHENLSDAQTKRFRQPVLHPFQRPDFPRAKSAMIFARCVSR
jgi:hypothetical protein